MTDYREGTHREKKARKVHTCDECKQEIEKGEVYIRLSIFQNGAYTSVGRHKECVFLAGVLRDRLMTNEGFPLTLAAGLKLRPHVWREVKPRVETMFTASYRRLRASGLPL